MNQYAGYEHKNNIGSSLPTTRLRGKNNRDEQHRLERDQAVTEIGVLDEYRLLLTTDQV